MAANMAIMTAESEYIADAVSNAAHSRAQRSLDVETFTEDGELIEELSLIRFFMSSQRPSLDSRFRFSQTASPPWQAMKGSCLASKQNARHHRCPRVPCGRIGLCAGLPAR